MCLLHCHRAWRFTSVMRVGIWPETEGKNGFVFSFDGKKSPLIFWEFWELLIFVSGSQHDGWNSYVWSSAVWWFSCKGTADANEVVGQLHAANTKCIENFSLLKPQNLMKQSMTCTLKVHEVFIMFVLLFIFWMILELLVPRLTIVSCVRGFVDIV